LTSLVSVKKNFVFSFTEKVFRAAFSFISLGIVARYLGPEQYGTLSYLLALVSYFQLLGAFGLDQVLMRLLVGQSDKMQETFWESVIFKSFFSLVSLGLYVLFLYLNGEINTISILFGISILASVFDNNRILLETRNQHHIVAKIEIIYQMTSAMLKIVLCEFNFGIPLIFSLFVLDFFVTKLIMVIVVKNEVFPIRKINMSLQTFKFYIKAGGFHCLSTIFVIVYMKIDQVLVGKMMGMNALGNYSAAVRLSDAWYFLPMTVSSVFYPLALLYQKEKDNRYIQLIFDLTFWVSVVVIGVALFFSDEIFFLMFGDRFMVDKLLLNLLFYSGFFISLCISTAAWLNVKGDRKIIFLRSLLGALTNIILNLFLIPSYGLVGCGFATLISYGVTFLITFAHADSKECVTYMFRSVNFFKSFFRLHKIIKVK
jgi:O-antigen/teichoic acid export membrane protein